MPASHALRRLAGEQIRDWEIQPGGGSGGRGAVAAPPVEANAQIITIQCIKPLAPEYQLTVYSEQTVERAALSPPLPRPKPSSSHWLLAPNCFQILADCSKSSSSCGGEVPGLTRNAPCS